MKDNTTDDREASTKFIEDKQPNNSAFGGAGDNEPDEASKLVYHEAGADAEEVVVDVSDDGEYVDNAAGGDRRGSDGGSGRGNGGVEPMEVLEPTVRGELRLLFEVCLNH